ncbi:MAG TPA: PAS domain S-box protein [Gemmatimonadales bacterium]|nr:PAS domain S-box protein [Gemmatimonadales bacterium]
MEERRRSKVSLAPGSDARFRLLVESATEFAMITTDDAGTIETWNAGAEQVLGWSAAEAIGRPITLIFTAEDVAAGVVERECETARAQGRALDERWHVRKDGSRFWASGMIVALVDDAGRRLGLAKILRDLTDRRLGQQLQSAQRAVLEEIARGTPLPDVVRAIVDLLESQIAGATAAVRLAGPAEAPDATAASHGVTAGPTVPRRPAPAGAAPGPVREWLTPLGEVEGRPLGVVAVTFERPRIPTVHEQGAVDVAVQLVATVLARQRLETALALERAREHTEQRLLAAVLEQAPLGIVIAEAPSGRLWFTNRRVAALFGREPQATAADYGAGDRAFHPDGRPIEPRQWPIRRALTRGETVRDQPIEIEQPSGRRLEISVDAAPVRDEQGRIVAAVMTLWDVTAIRHAERQLYEAQRMQAVGTLAGGVAHEVNNQMTAVLGFGELVLRALGARHPQADDLRVMLEAAQRAARVSQELLTFTSQQVIQPRAIELPDLVSRLAPVLRQLLGADKTLVTSAAGAMPPIHADPGQVEQVLINLVANARDATTTGDRVTIAISEAALCADDVVGGRPVEVPGTYLRLVVSDTGHGMDAATRARVFEPFFTTRRIGQGTGLGLPSVYGIVMKHGGHLAVDSEPGAGTTVTVYWPTTPGPLQRAAAGPATGAAAGAPEGPPAAGAVVVVEDEPVVRELVVRTLEAEGFRVLSATDGEAARALLHDLEAPPALVVTDAIMPRMNGRQLAVAVAAAHPGVPVLYMSGYPREDVTRRELVPAGAPYLQKPFTPDALVRAVGELLPVTRREGA